MDQFGPAIRSARLARELSQSQVASRSGVSLATVQNLEAGRANPALNTLVAICKTVGLELFSRPVQGGDILLSFSGLGIPLLESGTQGVLRPSRERLVSAFNANVNSLKRLKGREESAIGSFLWALRDHFPSVWRQLDSPVEKWFNGRDQKTLSIKLRRFSVNALSEYL